MWEISNSCPRMNKHLALPVETIWIGRNCGKLKETTPTPKVLKLIAVTKEVSPDFLISLSKLKVWSFRWNLPICKNWWQKKTKKCLKRAGQRKCNCRSSPAPSPQCRNILWKAKGKKKHHSAKPSWTAWAGQPGKHRVPRKASRFTENRSCPGRGPETFTTLNFQGDWSLHSSQPIGFYFTHFDESISKWTTHLCC